ncbi:MAG: glycosyltransferase family 4 protein [Cyanobacteriota bacterium]|nr:glycosyltransferase family 4 protein [Cyanobacteriota bacterium]
MKVAYLVNQYPKVSHSFIRREILALERCGVRVERFAVRSCDGELVDEADKQELEKTQVILREGIVGLLLGLLSVALSSPVAFFKALKLALQVGWGSDRGVVLHLAYLAEACILRGWLRDRQVTHLHAHFGTNSTTVAMLCRVLGGPPYSFTVHGPEEFDKTGAISLGEKIVRAAFVVAISSFGKSQLFRWCDRQHWSKIHIVRCGVDGGFLAGEFVPIPETPQLVCIGRLSAQKGHLLLLEAARQLAKAGVEFKLVFVGDGELRSEVEDLIAKYDLKNSIEITGWASSATVRQYLLESRALVLPSFAEGLPVVIMESLALARPVLSTYVAGIPELVTPNKCGLLVPAGNANDLAVAMRTMLQMPVAELETWGRTGAERVAEQHNIDREAERLANLFRSEVEE